MIDNSLQTQLNDLNTYCSELIEQRAKAEFNSVVLRRKIKELEEQLAKSTTAST